MVHFVFDGIESITSNQQIYWILGGWDALGIFESLVETPARKRKWHKGTVFLLTMNVF